MFTIPNIISFFRILIAFLFPWLYGKYRFLSLVLLLVSGFSDIIDGYIARKFNQVSEVGKILDPVADKLTHFMILLAFCIAGYLPVFVVIIFAAVQIGMMVLASVYVKLGNKPFSSKWYGKLTSLLFFITAILVIAYKTFNTSFGFEEPVLIILALVTVFFFVYSLTGYISMALKANKERKTQQIASDD